MTQLELDAPDVASEALEGRPHAEKGGAFNALKKYRDFRLLWLSTLFVGIVAFSSGLAFILVAVPAGSFIDQLDRKVIYRSAQGLSTITALVLAVLVLTGLIRAWHLPLFAFVTGSVQACGP